MTEKPEVADPGGKPKTTEGPGSGKKSEPTVATGQTEVAPPPPPAGKGADPAGKKPPAESVGKGAEGASDEEPEALPPAGSTTGAYRILFPETDRPLEFNLTPIDRADPIPEEQSEINHGIYETWGVLKLLLEQGVFSKKKDKTVFLEFHGRLIQVAQVGLAAQNVKTRLAAQALEQIRQEIILRKGVAIKLKYLLRLAGWAFIGVLIGLLIVILSDPSQLDSGLAGYGFPAFKGYGWVIAGSMTGAWMSVAATRSTISFNEMADFVSSTVEPIVRLVFVGLLASAFALFIRHGLIQLEMGSIVFAEFKDKIGVAILLGLISGIGEKAVSLRIIERVQKTFTTGTN